MHPSLLMQKNQGQFIQVIECGINFGIFIYIQSKIRIIRKYLKMKFIALVFLVLGVCVIYASAAGPSGNLKEKLKASAGLKNSKLQSSNGKLKSAGLKGDYGYDYYDYGYDYDYGYYADSYYCDPYDYYCNNYGYDYGGYYKRR